MPSRIPFDSDLFSLETPRNLFDVGSYRRGVSLIRLLSFANLEEVDAYLLWGYECDEIVLLVDFCPKASGEVPNAFFEKRLCQVVSHIKAILPRARILLMDGAESAVGFSHGKSAA